MRRNDLQRLSRLRLTEARPLLRERAFAGAYYLSGYSVECALKACAARSFRRHDIPDRKPVNDLHTHDLERLADLAGLRDAIEDRCTADPRFGLAWRVVKDWKETSRYNPDVTRAQADAMFSACAGRRHGVVSWVKARW